MMAEEKLPFTILKTAAQRIADITGGKLRGDVVDEGPQDAQRLDHYSLFTSSISATSLLTFSSQNTT